MSTRFAKLFGESVFARTCRQLKPQVIGVLHVGSRFSVGFRHLQPQLPVCQEISELLFRSFQKRGPIAP